MKKIKNKGEIQNLYNNDYGQFSAPSYQSLVPVSIEKMVILMRTNPDNPEEEINIYDNNTNTTTFNIIRRDGLFYERNTHKALGCNKWSIDTTKEQTAVFSESSVQDYINLQINASPGNIYVFDIYLIDVYQKVSSGYHYIAEV